MGNNYLHSDITALVIKAFYTVYNTLGYGFLEKVYQNALLIELRKMGLTCSDNMCIKVYYDSHQVGLYVADILVEAPVIIEVKAAERLSLADEAQLTNYLKATEVEVGILLNFGRIAEFKRKVFSKEFKSAKLDMT